MKEMYFFLRILNNISNQLEKGYFWLADSQSIGLDWRDLLRTELDWLEVVGTGMDYTGWTGLDWTGWTEPGWTGLAWLDWTSLNWT